MYSRTQFARSHNTVFSFAGRHRRCRRFFVSTAEVLFAFVLIFLCTPALSAQQTPANVIGRVEGNDVSVEGGSGAANIGNSGLPNGGADGQLSSFSVTNGSVVTVHVGQARMALAAGGQIDICGPAKFTVLESGGGISLSVVVA